MTIEFTTPEFHASMADVRRAAASLSSARSAAAADVATLLDGWHGAAATAFAEAWVDWLRASASVASDLDSLASALSMFQTDLLAVDDSASAGLDALTRRLS